MAPSRPPRPPARPARDPKELLKKRGADLIRKVSDKDRYGIFLEPVDVDQVDGYADLISRPMDLSTAQKNLQMGVYRTPMELRADLDLIWSNCCNFNADDSIYFKEAVRLRALAARYYDDLVRLLAKDGVAAALGLSTSRHNAPSSVRMAQKRPPRHRPTSQTSDVVARVTSPSLQTSDPNSMDVDGDSNSASASASAPNLTTFRDIHLRRARANYDAAVAAAATAATEAREAAEAAGLPSSSPSSGGQIFSGPGGLLRDNTVLERTQFTPKEYPIITDAVLRDSCCEIPIAWRRIARWHSRGVTPSKFLSKDRARDVRYGRQFQNYVHNSAPLARRLLATLLDPQIVREHDLNAITGVQVANGGPVESDLRSKKAASKVSKSTEPGAVISLNGTLRDIRKNGIHDGMDTNFEEERSVPQEQDTPFKSPKRPRGKPADSAEKPDNTKVAKTAFGTFLMGVVGPERLRKFHTKRLDELERSSQHVPQKNSIYRLRALLKGKGIDPAFISRILSNDPDCDQNTQARRDHFAASDGDSQSHRRGLNHLLSSNYATMMNVLRLRALRENADEATQENLEDRERECVERLADGMSLAVRSLPPRFVVHPLDAAESAVAMARSISTRDAPSQQP